MYARGVQSIVHYFCILSMITLCLLDPVKEMTTTGAQNLNKLNTFFLLVRSLLNSSMGYQVSTWHSINQPV